MDNTAASDRRHGDRREEPRRPQAGRRVEDYLPDYIACLRRAEASQQAKDGSQR